jgi:hypothetical protein
MAASSALEISSLAGSSLLLATLNPHAAHATKPVLRPVSTAAESTLHKAQTPLQKTLRQLCFEQQLSSVMRIPALVLQGLRRNKCLQGKFLVFSFLLGVIRSGLALLNVWFLLLRVFSAVRVPKLGIR